MRALILAWVLIVAPVGVSAHPQPAQDPTYTIAWDFYPGASAEQMTALYRYEALIDGQPYPLSPSCLAGSCSALLDGPSLAIGTPYTFAFRVACSASPTDFGASTTPVTFTVGEVLPAIPSVEPPANPCLQPSQTPPPPTILGPCNYQPPAGGAMEQRPIGQMMQGFNPIGPSGTAGNQGDRIRQLKVWGWDVVLAQFVEGHLRADKLDRLFLIVACKGLAP